MRSLQQVPVGPIDPRRFEQVSSAAEYRALLGLIDRGAEALRGRVVWNVNSTAAGGGVAELLRTLLGYSRGAGVDARWAVISAGPEFFTVTKRLHNHLHGFKGDGGGFRAGDRAIYETTLSENAAALVGLVRPCDIVILHDPQTAGLVDCVKGTGARVIWRCHVGLDHPNALARGAWSFLRPYLVNADAYVFSRPTFAWDGLDDGKLSVIHPSIDAFSAKNQDQIADQSLAILAAAGIVSGRGCGRATFTRGDGTPGRVDRNAAILEATRLDPCDRLVLQVSRWDTLKDPVGVMTGFERHIADRADAHLVLAGPSADSVADDPEGAQVLRQVHDTWQLLAPDARRRVHIASLPMADAEENAAIVNALQRHAEVVVQKSLAEGFGLTVAEAMWKQRPVVASATGGIQDQIIDGESGILVSDPRDLREFADAVVGLLDNRERGRQMGLAARARIREHFLGPRHLGHFFDLIERVVASDKSSAIDVAATRPLRLA